MLRTFFSCLAFFSLASTAAATNITFPNDPGKEVFTVSSDGKDFELSRVMIWETGPLDQRAYKLFAPSRIYRSVPSSSSGTVYKIEGEEVFFNGTDRFVRTGKFFSAPYSELETINTNLDFYEKLLLEEYDVDPLVTNRGLILSTSPSELKVPDYNEKIVERYAFDAFIVGSSGVGKEFLVYLPSLATYQFVDGWEEYFSEIFFFQYSLKDYENHVSRTFEEFIQGLSGKELRVPQHKVIERFFIRLGLGVFIPERYKTVELVAQIPKDQILSLENIGDRPYALEIGRGSSSKLMPLDLQEVPKGQADGFFSNGNNEVLKISSKTEKAFEVQVLPPDALFFNIIRPSQFLIHSQRIPEGEKIHPIVEQTELFKNPTSFISLGVIHGVWVDYVEEQQLLKKVLSKANESSSNEVSLSSEELTKLNDSLDTLARNLQLDLFAQSTFLWPGGPEKPMVLFTDNKLKLDEPDNLNNKPVSVPIRKVLSFQELQSAGTVVVGPGPMKSTKKLPFDRSLFAAVSEGSLKMRDPFGPENGNFFTVEALGYVAIRDASYVLVRRPSELKGITAYEYFLSPLTDLFAPCSRLFE